MVVGAGRLPLAIEEVGGGWRFDRWWAAAQRGGGGPASALCGRQVGPEGPVCWEEVEAVAGSPWEEEVVTGHHGKKWSLGER
jgi:hypothetical protein